MSVLDAARNVADDYPGGAKALAQRMDKNPFTLMHELAGTGTAKLGLLTAVKMTTRSGDLRILNEFASECGCLVLPMPEALRELHGGELMRQLARTAKEFADLVSEVSGDLADDKVSDNEMARIVREWSELVATGQTLVAGVRAKHDADKPSHLRAA